MPPVDPGCKEPGPPCGRAIIFRETIRDLSEQQQPGVGIPETVLAALTTVHEVGHLFALDHDPLMGPIMMIEQIKLAADQAAQDAIVFSGAGLRKIIVQYEPRGDREIND
jgi:hypothetical protein